jgi:hypothetical protein
MDAEPVLPGDENVVAFNDLISGMETMYGRLSGRHLAPAVPKLLRESSRDQQQKVKESRVGFNFGRFLFASVSNLIIPTRRKR